MKKVGLVLEESLHLAVKSAAAGLHITLEQAYTRGMSQWLKHVGVADPVQLKIEESLSRMNREELRFMGEVLPALRHLHRMFRASLTPTAPPEGKEI